MKLNTLAQKAFPYNKMKPIQIVLNGVDLVIKMKNCFLNPVFFLS